MKSSPVPVINNHNVITQCSLSWRNLKIKVGQQQGDASFCFLSKSVMSGKTWMKKDREASERGMVSKTAEQKKQAFLWFVFFYSN